MVGRPATTVHRTLIVLLTSLPSHIRVQPWLVACRLEVTLFKENPNFIGESENVIPQRSVVGQVSAPYIYI
jgi:hypothetical protein